MQSCTVAAPRALGARPCARPARAAKLSAPRGVVCQAAKRDNVWAELSKPLAAGAMAAALMVGTPALAASLPQGMQGTWEGQGEFVTTTTTPSGPDGAVQTDRSTQQFMIEGDMKGDQMKWSARDAATYVISRWEGKATAVGKPVMCTDAFDPALCSNGAESYIPFVSKFEIFDEESEETTKVTYCEKASFTPLALNYYGSEGNSLADCPASIGDAGYTGKLRREIKTERSGQASVKATDKTCTIGDSTGVVGMISTGQSGCFIPNK